MSAEMPLIDIRPDHWKIVQRILQEHVPDLEVWAFGSRAKWSAKEFSDLDLAVITDEPLPIDTSLALNEAFTEPDLPWKVDVVDWASVGDGFKKAIKRDKVFVQEKGENTRSEWKQVSLHEVCQKVTSGGTPSRRNPAYYEAGVWPWVKTQELKDGWIDDTEEHITDAAIAESSAKVLPTNTVLLAMYGATVGQLGILRRPMACNQACCAIISDDKKSDFRFLYYYLLNIRSELRNLATGAAQQNLSGALIKSLKLTLPDLSGQRAIARILGTLDDKIELNRKQNETLEAMARAMFKAWFVDFEPVRAKMEGRWKRGQSLPGMPAHLYDLFPDRMVESELGEIPEGWKMRTLADYATLNPESWSKVTRPSAIRYVDLFGTKWGRIESVTDYASSEAPSRAQRVLRPLDTLVGTVRPGNGSYTLIGEEGLTGSTGFAVLRPLNRINAEFVYLAATAAENIERLSNLADGGAYPAVRPEVVLATPVPIINPPLINVFSRQISPMLEEVSENESESRVLAQLRDTLLPKLVSGALLVSGTKE